MKRLTWDHRLAGVLAPAVLTVMALPGCYFQLDILGVEETVKQAKDDALADDEIEDKNPQFDPNRTIVEEFDGCEFELNKSASVTRLSISKLEGDDAFLDGAVFPTRIEALEALGDRHVMPSMEVVNGSLKPFNDGLYAAIELAAEDGSDSSPINKAALFRDLLASLVEHYQSGPAGDRGPAERAATQLAAAVELAGETPDAPPEIASAASTLVSRFEELGAEARPIGFYTWTPELERIFTRDRFLQSDPTSGSDIGAYAATALMLGQNPALHDDYRSTLDLYAGLTNPAWDQSVLDLLPHVTGDSLADLAAIESAFADANPTFSPGDPCGTHLAYLPAATSPETELFQELMCAGILTPGDSAIDVLIDAIRNGEVDLTPTDDSGWYDRQLYALETLLLPERAPENDHLLLTKEYKEKLVETFKSLITQTRETHVKSLARAHTTDAAVDPREVDIYPLLPVEPFPTFFLRTARAYAFLHLMLQGAMGEEFLSTSSRLLEDGSRNSVPLGEELSQKTRLVYGLHVSAARSIGMAHQITDEELAGYSAEDAEASAREWLAEWRQDTDVARDPRVIVPINGDNGVWSYWAVVGVKVVKVHANFYEGYEPQVVPISPMCTVRDFVPYEPYLLMEQFVEVSRRGDPLTRDEFRAICDEHDTTEAITEALSNVE